MKPVLIITLNPAIDKTIIVDKFKLGCDCRAVKVVNTAGGKGINVARTLSILGAQTLCSGFLGGFNGEFVKKELDKEEINHDFFQIVSNTRINLTVFDKFLTKTTRIIEPAPQISQNEIKKFFKKCESLVKECSFLVISGSGLGYTQLSPDLIKIAKKYKIFSALDTSKKELKAGVKARPFILKINLQEAQELLGQKLSSLSKIKKALRDIYSRGIKVCAITLGVNGAVLFDGKEIVYLKAAKINAKTTVGCGDAFLAGLVFSFLNKKCFDDCSKFAVTCGTSAAKSLIPGEININEIR
jgi:1-phosphofructokinase family hexose kinase